jgi:UDP-N-acetyl-D-glucosamine/UDP-N-acetyl-D-galactosamine dehydrogenase
MPHGRKLAVIGLGYVGLPVAVAFGRQGTPVIGFDIDTTRISELKAGRDCTRGVEPDGLAGSNVVLTSDPGELSAADFFIVTVPTPIDQTRRPDLTALLRASRTVGEALKKGDIVVYESTVYPGATEEDCVPILEQASGLLAGRDFTVGYSPERINPWRRGASSPDSRADRHNRHAFPFSNEVTNSMKLFSCYRLVTLYSKAVKLND